jgi:Ca2+:H+ antiporter
MLRKLLWASLLLAPLTVAVDKLTDAGDVTLFVLAALALIPLAWLVGESTEHAAEHTGPGIGGFLNASFGNAPELIVALFAVGANLPVVVLGSLAGSVISNLLLVYGITQTVGPDRARLDRRSLLVQLALVAAAVAAFTLPTALGQSGRGDQHAVGTCTPITRKSATATSRVKGPGRCRFRSAHSPSRPPRRPGSARSSSTRSARSRRRSASASSSSRW